MNPISPSLTASSSTTAFHADQEQNLDKMTDFSELFDFDQFEAASSVGLPLLVPTSNPQYASLSVTSLIHQSHSHSPKTISPNHTPSPLPMSGLSPFAASPSFGFRNFDSSINDHDMTQLDFAAQAQSKPLPVQDDVVKQEPVEFGFNTLQEPTAAPVDNGFSLAGLHPDQQKALQELLINMMQYQNKYGAELPVTATPAALAIPSPAPNFDTISPDLIFGGTTESIFSSAGPSTLVTPTPPVIQATPAPAAAEPDSTMEEHDEPLLTVEEADAARGMRHESIMSSGFDDLDSKIDSLVPLPTIFSTGRGKGGKKGGGMSSVVRGDDEELDDDDSWRPSPEEYKKLSSKEKRQLRNKLSARAFRNRRKDYIGTLESHIKDRDSVIDAIKAELVNSRSENQDLRRELAALKSNTMAILHPDTANVKSESLPMKAAIAAAPTLAAAAAGPSQPIRRAPTPKFNIRKDVPSSPAAYNLWNNSDYLSGGSTICHTALTPDIVMVEEDKAAPSKMPLPLRTFADLPRMNLNPNLNDSAPRMPSLSTTANSKDLNNTFSEWSENTPFTLRSMDSYRIQMWSRLAREASSDKAHVPVDSRPKFFVESAYTQAASTHISSKLASSFWSAFAGSTSGNLDSDKLAAVVTGKAKLKVVDVNEKDEAESLIAALGGLRLQSGLSRSEGCGLRARENPLGALGSFFRCPGACPQRA